MKRHLSALLLLVSAVSSAPLRAEVKEVQIGYGSGFGFLPIIVMQHRRLLEHYAKAAGLGEIKATYHFLSGGAAQNDALLAGQIDFATSGVSTFLTLWARTKGNIDVRGIAAISAMPIYLNTRNPNVKTIRDFTEADRIAVPAVKVSPQAMLLQMAAAQVWGDAGFNRLDPLTVAMPQADAMTALLSGTVSAHFANPPFQFWELEKPGIRLVLNSFNVLGGPHTFIMSWTTGRFREANPRVYKAFWTALEEATALVNRDRRSAAEIYKTATNDKGPVENILKILEHPEMQYRLTPENILKFADFMHKIGSIKIKPENWRELFFPETHSLSGS